MKRIVLAALLALCATSASAEDKVSLRLNWLIYGFHMPFYLGVERGLYHQNGIDLTVGEGQGSGRAVQVVAAGSDTFGLSDGASIIAGAARGAPVQAVMGIMNRSPYAVIVRQDTGITDFKGLAGRTLAASTGEAGLVVFPALLRANHMPPDSVRFLRVDGAAKLVATLENQVAGMLGGLENQALILPQKGLKVTSLAYSDFGVNTIGLAIHTTRDTLQKNPDLVRRFIKATRASFELAMADPDAAIAAGLKVKPDLDHALSLDQLKAGLALVKSPRGKDQPVGWMSEQDWAETLALMKEFQDLKTDQPARAFWTNDYLPQ